MVDLPLIIAIGGIKISAHLVLEFAAYASGFALFRYLRKRYPDQLSNNTRHLIVLGAILGALIGSKLLAFLENPQYFFHPQALIIYLLYSKSIVGGLLGGVIGVELAKRLNNVKTSTGDFFTYPLILGMVIGRLGCFLSGTHDGTHGNPTAFFLGMDLGDGVIRHPTALYEIFILILMGMSIYLINKSYSLKQGTTFKLFMIFYLTWRLLIENIKPIVFVPYLHLSAIQLACCFGLFYYSSIYISSRRLRNSA